MALIPEKIDELKEKAAKIKSELTHASEGSDEGLIPIYSILNEISEIVDDHATLAVSIQIPREQIDALLDEFKPWDNPTIQLIGSFADWFDTIIEPLQKDEEFADFSPTQSSEAPAEQAQEEPQEAQEAPTQEAIEPDLLMELNLEDDQELLTEFQTEAIDHLEAIEQAVLALENDPKEPESMSAIFRAFHTIKGVAGFLHLLPIQNLAHEVESLLDLARNDKLTLRSSTITIVLESRDALQALVDQITEALDNGTIPTEIIPVNGLIKRVMAEAKAGLAAEDALNGPPPEIEIKEAPKGFFETNEVATPGPETPSRQQAEPAPEARMASPQIPADDSPAPLNPTLASAPKEQKNKKKTGNAERSTIRVNTYKLDGLMDTVGELVIVQSQLQESANTISGAGTEDGVFQRNMSQLSRITKELQHTSMALRMVPIKPTFQKTSRLVRDVAAGCKKLVNFSMAGEDTELDRNVVEQIGDPLVHMIRNAIDHGLEPPEEREKIGKNSHGKVHLCAYHQGSNIIIELSDDGRGIDPDKVLAKAINNGIAEPGTNYSNDEIYNFLFAPGFSTAAQITDVSGRGVGMDVVKKNIEQLRGTIEIESQLGKGSTFKIKLPLTMAIIDGLVVRVGADRFILPTTSVKIAVRPEDNQLSTVKGGAEVFDLRGKTVPITRLHERFNIPTDINQTTEGILVIVESFGKPYALLVDEMISKQEVVIKSLGNMMQGLPGVAGGAILGDGTIAIILDPSSLFNTNAAASLAMI